MDDKQKRKLLEGWGTEFEKVRNQDFWDIYKVKTDSLFRIQWLQQIKTNCFYSLPHSTQDLKTWEKKKHWLLVRGKVKFTLSKVTQRMHT